jgi:hypothetical protein
LGIVVVVAVLGVAISVAAVSRGEKRPPAQRTPSAASQHFGDDADLMRRLQRKKLVGQQP